MSKYSVEFKLEVVKYVLNEGHGCKCAANYFNIPSKSVIERWVRRYKEHGNAGLLKNNVKYDRNYKVQMIEYMHINHLSLNETATHFNMGCDVLAKWERIYYEEGSQALFEERRGRKNMNVKPRMKKLSKEVEEDLITEVQRLRMENEYLKKLNALVQEKEKSKKKTK